MTLLAALLLAAVAFVSGAHVLVPWRSAGVRPPRLWAPLAPLALAATLTALLALLATDPGRPLFAGWGSDPLATAIGRALLVLAPALLLADLVVAVGRERLEPAGWRLAGAFALPLLVAAAAAAELLAAGTRAAAPLLLATLGRSALALAAGESVAPPPRPAPAPHRPRWALPAGLLLALHPLALPGWLLGDVVRGGHPLTLAAGCLLLVAGRWLPARLRRPAVVAAVLLACLYLGTVATLADDVPAPRPAPMTLPG